jgi:ABC-type branched-subunit amino acid transport system substrate-binding protein
MYTKFVLVVSLLGGACAQVSIVQAKICPEAGTTLRRLPWDLTWNFNQDSSGRFDGDASTTIRGDANCYSPRDEIVYTIPISTSKAAGAALEPTATVSTVDSGQHTIQSKAARVAAVLSIIVVVSAIVGFDLAMFMPFAKFVVEYLAVPTSRQSAVRQRSSSMSATKLLAFGLLVGILGNATPAHALDETCLADNLGINILVDTDNVITEEYNADLPDLPIGTRSVSYGPSPTSCTSFDGVVVIGGAGSLKPTNSFYGYSDMQQNAMKLFLDWMNDERGGLQVGDKTYAMRFVWVGDNQQKSQITNSIAHAIRGTNADFAFAGYSSGLSALAAKQSFAENKIMMTWGASVPTVHSQNDLTFGFLPPAPIFSKSTLAAIAANAEAIDSELTPGRCGGGLGTCKSSIQVGFIQADASYTRSNCAAAPAWAESYGLVVVQNSDGEPLMATVPKSPSNEETKIALQALQAAGVNVVVGCTYTSTGRAIIAALEEVDYSPFATVITATIDSGAYVADIASGWWQGEYILGPAPWNKNAPLVGEFSGLDSITFAEKFQARFGDYPIYQAASAYAAISTLSAAIETAGSLDTASVASALRAMTGANSMTEFYTSVNFNADGQVEPSMFVTQFAPQNPNLNIVAPPESVYGEHSCPFPPRAARRLVLQLCLLSDRVVSVCGLCCL